MGGVAGEVHQEIIHRLIFLGTDKHGFFKDTAFWLGLNFGFINEYTA